MRYTGIPPPPRFRRSLPTWPCDRWVSRVAKSDRDGLLVLLSVAAVATTTRTVYCWNPNKLCAVWIIKPRRNLTFPRTQLTKAIISTSYFTLYERHVRLNLRLFLRVDNLHSSHSSFYTYISRSRDIFLYVLRR